MITYCNNCLKPFNTEAETIVFGSPVFEDKAPTFSYGDIDDINTYETSFKNKNSIGVLLEKLITESEANMIGEKLSQGKSEDFFVFFHIDKSEENEGPNFQLNDWANYNQKRKNLTYYDNTPLQLLGLTKQALENESNYAYQPLSREISGQWIDSRSGEKITLYKENGQSFIEKHSGTTFSKIYSVTTEIKNNLTKIEVTGINLGYHLLLTKNGSLNYANEIGSFTRLNKIELPSEFNSFSLEDSN